MSSQRREGRLEDVDREHKVLQQTEKLYGQPMVDLLIEKRREVEEYNPSGCYPVSVREDIVHLQIKCTSGKAVGALHVCLLDSGERSERGVGPLLVQGESISCGFCWLLRCSVQLLWEGGRFLKLREVLELLVPRLVAAQSGGGT